MKMLLTNTAALNTGDAAILFATIDILRRAFGQRLEVVVYDQQAGVASRYYPDLAFRPILFDQVSDWAHGRWRNGFILLLLAAAAMWRLPLGKLGSRLLPRSLRASLAEFASADLVVSAGGTYLVPHYRIFPKILDLLVADALGRPYVLFTQSLGPFPQRRQRLLRRVLQRARLILVRDARSRRHLVQFGVRADRVAECADAAFALTPQTAPYRAAAPPHGQALRVAVSVRDWPHLGGEGERGMDRYFDAVAALVRWLIDGHGAQVTFISTCQGVAEYWTDDSLVAEAVVSRLPENERASVRIDRNFHPPRNLIAELAGFDLVVATRLHVAILALCAGVPVLPIAYEFKTTELFSRFGLGDLVQDMQTVTGEALCGAVSRILAARGDVCAMLPRWVAEERRSALAAGDHIRRALGAAA